MRPALTGAAAGVCPHAPNRTNSGRNAPGPGLPRAVTTVTGLRARATATLYFFLLSATWMVGISTIQATTVTTGRLRSPLASVVARILSTSIRTMSFGTTTTVAPVKACGPSARSRTYPLAKTRKKRFTKLMTTQIIKGIGFVYPNWQLKTKETD